MTNDALIDYYAKLLIAQYIGQPKASATIMALASIFIVNQLPAQVRDGFQIGSAVGAQLDIIGKYVGVTRSGRGFTGPVVLSDADFTKLIKLKIIENNADAALATIQDLLNKFIPNAIMVFDTKSMHMNYWFNPNFGSLGLAELIVTEDLLPKPMGVSVGSVVYAPFTTKFFACRTTYGPNIHGQGFNLTTDYKLTDPWINASYLL